MALREAIETYHDLLTDEVAADSWGQLEEQLQRRGLYFGNRPLCTVLRPRFLTPEQYTFLRQRIRPLLRPSKIHSPVPSMPTGYKRKQACPQRRQWRLKTRFHNEAARLYI